MEQKINIIPKRNTKVTKENRGCAYGRAAVNNPDMLHPLGERISIYMSTRRTQLAGRSASR